MSDDAKRSRKVAAIVGAMVADAAALGLHWIYTQPKIRRAAPEAPEFQDPDPANYEGVPAFFAHEHKRSGDSTMYGENVLLVLQAMSDQDGEFDTGTFLSRYQTYFGPGGLYVGYVDGPTRGTLYNAQTMTHEIEEHANQLELDAVNDETRAMIAHYVSRYFLEFDTDGLKRTVREAVGMHDGISERDLAACEEVVDAMQMHRKPTGADDAQMPALTRVAALVARYGGDGTPEDLERLSDRIDAAIRVTNNNDLAVDYAKGLGRLLARVTSDEGAKRLDQPDANRPMDVEAFTLMAEEAFGDLPDERAGDISKALSQLKQDTKAITLKYGPACDCAMGMPSALHNVATARSFTEAVRKNIYSCGDSCGRAIIIGPLLGAIYGIGGERGIPNPWIDRTRLAADARRLALEIVR